MNYKQMSRFYYLKMKSGTSSWRHGHRSEFACARKHTSALVVTLAQGKRLYKVVHLALIAGNRTSVLLSPHFSQHFVLVNVT